MGETCYSDFGAMYDIFLAINFISQVYLCRKSLLYVLEIKAKKKKGAKTSSMEKILYLNMFACGIRALWLITIIPGEKAYSRIIDELQWYLRTM